MANGTDSERFMASQVRTGLKREFEFALKYQSQITESTGRTRASKARISGPNNAVPGKEEAGKGLNGEVGLVGVMVSSSEESMRSDVVDSVDDVAKCDNVLTNNNINISVVKKVPSKLKDLFDSGLLEGLTVKYIRGSKGRGMGETRELSGMIKGSGILCFCDICKGIEVVTANQFELHAGSLNKRPPEYIFLENGNSLRDLMNACKNSPLGLLEETIRMAACCLSREDFNIWKASRGSVPEDGSAEQKKLLRNSSVESNESRAGDAQVIHLTKVVDRSSGEVLLSKSSSSVQNVSSSKSKSQGKITRKDIGQHKIVFEEGVLPEGTEVAYYSQGEKLRTGHKEGSSIRCHCCSSLVSPSQFEAHAGCASRRKPFHNIYTSNGVSLHELAVSMLKRGKCHTNVNDDLCIICADGGDLLCCDGCPRSFHRECVNLPYVPTGTWYCIYCQDKFSKENFDRSANAIAAGRVAGVDLIEQITNHSIRIINITEVEDGGCVLCRSRDFAKTGFGPETVILCDQCEREFHVGCLKDHNMADLMEMPKDDWFCSSDCTTIHAVLQKLVINGEEKLPDSILDVIKKKQEEKGLGSSENVDLRWRLLSGKVDPEGSRLLLSKAVTIFHESFGQIVDPSTSCDLIPPMVYGRKVGDKEFGGMYCAVLTVNSSLVSAGIIRFLGQEVAELPLVGTSCKFQGQGYFQSLFSCIERLLGFLHVKKIVLPAADGAESIWTNKFGFNRMTEDELKDCVKDYHVMTFQGIPWFQKPVPPCRVLPLSKDAPRIQDSVQLGSQSFLF